MKIYTRLAVLFLFVAGLFAPAHALMLAGSGTDRNTTAPTNNPGWCHIGWSNVGSVRSPINTSRAGVVYLYDNWFITTYHAWWYDHPTGVVVGASYTVDTNSMIRLTNSITITTNTTITTNLTIITTNTIVSTNMQPGADVALFRVTQKPNLPPLNLTTMSPGGLLVPVVMNGNKTIFMIGSGHPRVDAPTYWDAGWTNTTQSNAVYSGYKFWPDRSQCVLRWGSNQIYTTNYKMTMPSPFGDIWSFVTQFNTNAGPDECQIAPLDSGGGVFYKNNGYWELAGLMSTMSQPDGSDAKYVNSNLTWGIANGGFSYIVDLSYYRDQIMDIIKPSGGWPDLMPDLSETGRRLQMNEPVNITITTTNRGTGTASTNVTTLQIIVNGQTSEVVRTEIPLLNGGAAVTSSYTFVTNTPGTYTLMAAVDSSNAVHESYEQNNTKTIVFQVGPDLILSGQLPATTKAADGGAISIDIVTKNNGVDIAVGPFETALYLSTNYSLTAPGEAELSGMTVLARVQLSNMPPGSFSTNAFSFTAPTNAGTYYMRARTDASNTVAEANEVNNWGPPLVLSVGPDLIISGAWPSATNAAAGAPVSIAVVTKNDGVGAAGPFQTRLYLSTDQYFTTLNEAELRNLAVSDPVSFQNLSANTSSTNSFTVTAPTGTGTYYLRARADPSNTVSEANEANNWGTLLTIGVGPDLVIAGSSPDTTNAAAGSPVSIQVFTKNQGTSDVTNDFVLGFYLLTPLPPHTPFTPSDKYAGGDTPIKEQTIQGLPAGKTVTNTFTFTAPASNDRYLLVAKADDYDSSVSTNKGAVAEAYETNNEGTSAGQYSILYIGPDLSVAFAKTNTVRAIANSSITLDLTTRNNGGQDTAGIDTTLYLSSTNTFATYTNLQTKVSTIAAYGSWTEPFEFRAPCKPGTYYLIAQTDGSRRIAEINENNNFSEILILKIHPALPWLNLLLE